MATFYRKNKKKRIIKNVIIIIVLVFAFLILALYFVSVKFYKTGMVSDREIASYEDRENYSTYNIYSESTDVATHAFNEKDKKIGRWTTLNSDGLALVGYAHRQSKETNKWAIVVHGYNSSSSEMNDYGGMFFDKGYNVLVIDNEYHGESEGTHITMGMKDSLNVVDWTWKLVNKEKDPEIVLFGLSMGASSVMMASDPNLQLPSNVKAIVEDCGYTSISDIFSYQLKVDYGLPAFPVIPAVNLYNKIKNGYFFDERSPIEAVSNTQLPVLFIHGTTDDYVPYDMGKKLYEAHQGEKDFLWVEGADHAKSFETSETEYKNKVYDFIDKYIK